MGLTLRLEDEYVRYLLYRRRAPLFNVQHEPKGQAETLRQKEHIRTTLWRTIYTYCTEEVVWTVQRKSPGDLSGERTEADKKDFNDENFFACFLCISHKNRVFISHQILDYSFLCFSLTVNLLCLIACLYVVYLLFLCFILFLVVFLNRYLYCSTRVDNSFHLSGEFFPLE